MITPDISVHVMQMHSVVHSCEIKAWKKIQA